MFNRYYQDELNKLKGLAAEFARANPAVAPMLSGTSADPDVERLLEGVAFLTGLTRQKLDDQFPEFIQELTNLLFPHYLRPVPASTLIGFNAKGPRAQAARVAAGAELASVPVDGTSCRFRTTCDLDVEPLRIAEVNLLSHAGAAPVLMIDFEMDGGASIAQWNGDSIRLFLFPGMGHCGGGEGPNSFDGTGTLAQWFEKGQAPTQLLASHRTNGVVDRTRPVCAYPQVAAYKGSGSVDDAANFVCKSP